MSTKTCENCGKEVEESVNFCPKCGSSSFTSLNSELTDSNNNIDSFKSLNQDISSLESVNPIIAKLFYWNENGYYYFSKTKFFTILIFFDIFIARIYYTADIIVSFIVAFVVALISFFIGRSIHRKNDEFVSSEGLLKDIKNLLLYMNGSISITKILTILIYFILIVGYCIIEGGEMFFAGTLISLVFAIPIYYLGKYLQLDEYIK